MTTNRPFSKVRKTRLYEEVVDQVKKAILEGHLKPGDRLPSEREMCQVFGIGRPAVREALRTLSVMGLIEVNAGVRGSYVKDPDITQYLEAVREQLSWLITVGEETVEDLWAVRRYVELGIAHTAAANATPEDFVGLDKLLEEMEACGDDIYSYFPLALEFHRRLALATKNKIFFIFWEIFEDVLMTGYTPHLEKLFPAGPEKLLGPNRVLLEAIKSGEPREIDRAIEIHAEEEKFFPGALRTVDD